MIDVEIAQVSKKRFRALVGPSRSPAASFGAEELAWYSAGKETILGTIVYDQEDHDYSVVILGRDAIGRYRAIAWMCSIHSIYLAFSWLKNKSSEIILTGKSIFPQGDETGVALDLFTPVVHEDKLHPYFSLLRQSPGHVAARGIISEMMKHYVDVDGNFVEQFQTTGFDARVWELYLYNYLLEEELFLLRDFHAPDFVVEKYGHRVAIEATIVGRRKKLTSLPQLSNLEVSQSEIDKKLNDEMPIYFGSPLYSKLNKKYWELEHVSGSPLVIAIADFHDDQSMLWSSRALFDYLYGVRHKAKISEAGFEVAEEPISEHRVGDKVIPSGFFFQPDSENVSAVLFSASGTISKFTRIGVQAGFGGDKLRVLRKVMHHDFAIDATKPKISVYEVTTGSCETWGEGLSMFHNPNATHPVPVELFPSIAHHYFRNNRIESDLPAGHVYSSFSVIVAVKDD